MERPMDVKVYQSMPDNFDIIKVTAYNSAGNILYGGSIVSIIAKAESGSSLPDTTGIYTLSETITLVDGDSVKLLGYARRYSGIYFAKATDLTGSIFKIGSEVKDMTALNNLVDGTIHPIPFTHIQLKETDTVTVLIAYK